MAIDFVVCLGGDGVILHASYLFRRAIPPVRVAVELSLQCMWSCGFVHIMTHAVSVSKEKGHYESHFMLLGRQECISLD